MHKSYKNTIIMILLDKNNFETVLSKNSLPLFVYFGVCERQETKLEFSVSRSVDESHCVLDTSIPLR